jgi:hypothetical protein
MSKLIAERLREVLNYDQHTGVFTWRVSPSNNVRVGARAGNVDTQGYRLISVDAKLYRANRLAWLYMTGEWPLTPLDHINCVRDDERWANLRPATVRQNNANSAFRRICKGCINGP